MSINHDSEVETLKKKTQKLKYDHFSPLGGSSPLARIALCPQWEGWLDRGPQMGSSNSLQSDPNVLDSNFKFQSNNESPFYISYNIAGCHFSRRCCRALEGRNC